MSFKKVESRIIDGILGRRRIERGLEGLGGMKRGWKGLGFGVLGDWEGSSIGLILSEKPLAEICRKILRNVGILRLL